MILLWVTITINRERADTARRSEDERNKLSLFTDFITEINNTKVDNIRDINTVMSVRNVIDYSYKYLKALGSLWQYYRDEPNEKILDSEFFKPKAKVTGSTPVACNI